MNQRLGKFSKYAYYCFYQSRVIFFPIINSGELPLHLELFPFAMHTETSQASCRVQFTFITTFSL